MATRDLYNLIKVEDSLHAAVRTSDTLSNAIDMAGFESLTTLVQVGAAGDTLSGTDKIELELMESFDGGSTYSQVAASDILGAVTGTNTGCFAVITSSGGCNTTYKAGYIGSAEFVKVNINFSGTHSTGTSVGVVAVKSHSHIKPVA